MYVPGRGQHQPSGRSPDDSLLPIHMKFNRLRILISSPLIALAMTGCGGGSDGTVVANETKTIADGYYLTYALPAGKYEAQISSSNNGVVVEWIGSSNCGKSGEVKTYDYACTLTQTGQLKITNPTTFFLGGDEVVTVKVTQQ
mgnify:CR=1 FL=1